MLMLDHQALMAIAGIIAAVATLVWAIRRKP